MLPAQNFARKGKSQHGQKPYHHTHHNDLHRRHHTACDLVEQKRHAPKKGQKTKNKIRGGDAAFHGGTFGGGDCQIVGSTQIGYKSCYLFNEIEKLHHVCISTAEFIACVRGIYSTK